MSLIKINDSANKEDFFYGVVASICLEFNIFNDCRIFSLSDFQW